MGIQESVLVSSAALCNYFPSRLMKMTGNKLLLVLEKKKHPVYAGVTGQWNNHCYGFNKRRTVPSSDSCQSASIIATVLGDLSNCPRTVLVLTNDKAVALARQSTNLRLNHDPSKSQSSLRSASSVQSPQHTPIQMWSQEAATPSIEVQAHHPRTTR